MAFNSPASPFCILIMCTHVTDQMPPSACLVFGIVDAVLNPPRWVEAIDATIIQGFKEQIIYFTELLHL
jgi:hypothetical protein